MSWYAHSEPVEQLTSFLSHCWQDSRWEKALALKLYCCRTSILISTSLIVIITGVVQYLRLVPMPSYTFMIKNMPSSNGISCVIFGCLTWCLFLLFSPPVVAPGKWFLDCACICQGDGQLRSLGIRRIGDILEHSDRMVLLLSPRYFQRGWCTFEVATFLAANGVSRLDIVPLLRAKLVVSTFGVSIFGLTVFHVCTALGITEAVASIRPQPVIHDIPAYTFLVWLAPTGLVLGCVAMLMGRYLQEQRQILRQIGSFQFSQAMFSEEPDRAFVLFFIERLFGSVDNFEEEVHSKVLEKVKAQLGDDMQPLRFLAVVTGTLPWAWWGIDMACMDPAFFVPGDLIVGACTAFSFLPALFVLLVGFEKAKLALLGGSPACLQLAAGLGIFLLAAGSSTVLMGVTLQIEIFEPLTAKLSIWLFWALASGACFLQLPLRAGYELLPDRSGSFAAKETSRELKLRALALDDYSI